MVERRGSWFLLPGRGRIDAGHGVAGVGFCILLGLGLSLALLRLLGGPLSSRAGPVALYVAVDGDDGGDCDTVPARCRTVQRAVDLSPSGGEVWIAGGIYTDAQTASAGYVVALTRTVAVRGGWDPTFATQDPGGTPTTLDAGRQGRVLYVSGPATVTVEGLVLSGGDATARGGLGGGIYSQGAALILRRSVVTGNLASGAGLGLGGGIYLGSGQVTLDATRLVSNAASPGTGLGGGLYVDDGALSAVNGIVAHNVPDGLYLKEGQHSVVNCTLADNEAVGVWIDGGSLWMTNTVVAGHSVGVQRTAGMAWMGYGLLSMADAVLGDNVAEHHTLRGDPRFVDPASLDYHLQAGSPAIEGGDPAGTVASGGPAPLRDLDGHGRPVGPRVDVGAYEYPAGLTVLKWARPDLASPGAPLTYALRVTNTGRVPLTVVLTDVLPLHVTPTGTLTWSAALPAGSAWGWALPVTIQDGYVGPLTNALQAVAQEGATGVYTHLTHAAPTVALRETAIVVPEGAGAAQVTVALDQASPLTAVVRYATLDGSATAGEDYTPLSGTLTFTPGTLALTLTLPILDDALDEPEETLRLALPDAERAVLGSPDACEVRIVDDDDSPGVDFEHPVYEVGEGAGQTTITVALSAPSGWAVTVDWATSDGTARAPQDYVAGSGMLAFLPGETRAAFAVAIVDDDKHELGETVILSLSNAHQAILGVGHNPAMLTILDDEEGGSHVYLPSIWCVRLQGAGR